jgi:formylmethanofuran:tetrahydromethanopterin formyltransferase
MPARKRTVGRVILVTAGDPEPLVRVAAEVTGASVTVWRKADAGPSDATPSDATPSDAMEGGADELPDQLARALDGVAADRVLVVTGPGSRVEVIPLASA